MAALIPVQKAFLQVSAACLAARGLQTSCVLNKKHIRAGRYKISKNRDVALTYEEAKGPHLIGVDKSWLTWNTSNLLGEGRKSQMVVDDVFIRNFMQGTWHGKILSEIVIKRRHNMITLATFIKPGRNFQSMQHIYFLVGYTEEILASYFKCPVKLELQTANSHKDFIFKYI